jgi:hypothetical integral membrane protein (TIGR02206 family)
MLTGPGTSRSAQGYDPPVMRPFPRFGFEHLAALALLAGIGVLLCRFLRRPGTPERIRTTARLGLAGFLAIGLGFALAEALPLRGHQWLDILPLHFCDLAVLLAILALATRGQTVCELLYFWGLSGTVIAMLTPDVDRGFPDTHCISFFSLHGGVALSAAVVAFGLGIPPRPGAHWRVFGLTNLYAAIIAVIDWRANENFLYLTRKPSQPTLLDFMGPWPWYILAADVLALVIFRLLMIPFDTAPTRTAARRTPPRTSNRRPA